MAVHPERACCPGRIGGKSAQTLHRYRSSSRSPIARMKRTSAGRSLHCSQVCWAGIWLTDLFWLLVEGCQSVLPFLRGRRSHKGRAIRFLEPRWTIASGAVRFLERRRAIAARAMRFTVPRWSIAGRAVRFLGSRNDVAAGAVRFPVPRRSIAAVAVRFLKPRWGIARWARGFGRRVLANF